MKFVIAKPGYDASTETNPANLIISSDYSTLKYDSTGNKLVQIDASTDAVAASGYITHNLNYYPYVEVYVDAYIGSPTGEYKYCPYVGDGASVLATATYTLTKTKIIFYAGIEGFSTSVWNFYFKYFIFKNKLNYS